MEECVRQPRDYQTSAVEAVKTLWRQGKRRVVVVGPVGAGKTFVAELLMVPTLEHEWAQIVYIAHTETLIDQPAQRFNHLKIRSAFLKAGRKEDSTQALQFCSAPTLVRRDFVAAVDSKGQPFKRCLLIVDEAHRVRSNVYDVILQKLKQTFEYVYALLLTATPYRLDGRGLADVADALVEISTPRQLMQQGVILSPRYYSAPIPEGDPDEVVIRPGIIGDIVATWQLRAQGLPTICRAYSLDHSRLLVQRFVAAGVAAAHIDGTMTTAQRRRLLVGLATGRVPVLCAGSNIFDEGFDSRASYEMLLPQGDDALEAWRVLRCPDVELSASECLTLRQRVLDGVFSASSQRVLAFRAACHAVMVPGEPLSVSLHGTAGSRFVASPPDRGVSFAPAEWVDEIVDRFGLETVQEMGRVAIDHSRLPKGARGPFGLWHGSVASL
jgi:superfamily II DNA or RNA helicase